MEENSKSERLMSLDALRGADMLCIMGLSGAIMAFCSWIGMKDCWLATQMTHVDWHGFRQHDTIFPLFLFLAGVSWPFSYASQIAKGRSTGAILRKIAFRAFALFALGMVSAGLFKWDVASFRYDSVLAHTGFCWAVAAILYMFVRSWKIRLAIGASLLVVHWLILFSFTAPDAAALLSSTDPAVAKKVAAYAAYGTDNFSFTGNIAGWIDRMFMPGKLYEGIFDPDGLLAKMTGIVTAILGVMSGELLRSKTLSGNRKTAILLGAGVLSLALVFAWQPWCPVNKKIWTSTFILAAAAYSFIALAIFYWIIDVMGCRRWTLFFRVIGMNSITIYIAMRFMGFGTMSRYFFTGIAELGNADWSRFTFAIGQIALEWLFLWYLYRKNTFLRV
ncbi:MAG: DUF5009 domain-containing protein [bacterium]|nr:DUF5009 domain-containing protein [bacterium]